MKTQLLLFFAFASTLSSAQVNAYIDRVYEYRPAPGQFTNMLPEYESGDTKETMTRKAQDCIANNNQVMISLGGYGGYVVFGFDHRVSNVKGHYDFSILGNAFYANANPNPNASSEGGSSEPGIVMVSRDDNGNGIPDDKWYEIAGSEYYKNTTRHNYTLTYHRTPSNHVPTPVKGSAIIDDTYIAWESSDGENGFMPQNSFHRQNYYPLWIDDNELSFTGTLLPNNAVDESGNGTYYVLYCYGFGYADNHPNADSRSKFNIEWAVDEDGKHVSLDGIDFVKVYTGVNQYAGRLGETSTEIMGANDLHLLGGDDVDVYDKTDHPTRVQQIVVGNGNKQIYNILGQKVEDMSRPGIYIIYENGKIRKTITH